MLQDLNEWFYHSASIFNDLLVNKQLLTVIYQRIRDTYCLKFPTIMINWAHIEVSQRGISCNIFLNCCKLQIWIFVITAYCGDFDAPQNQCHREGG